MLTKLLLVAALQLSSAFDYDLVGAGDIALTDIETGIGGLKTLFTDNEIAVAVDGMEWEANDSGVMSGGVILYATFVDGELASEGNVTLDDIGRELPSSIDVGTVKVSKGGRHVIEVLLKLGESEVDTDLEIEAYSPGVAILPLLVILVLAAWTHMVSQY